MGCRTLKVIRGCMAGQEKQIIILLLLIVIAYMFYIQSSSSKVYKTADDIKYEQDIHRIMKILRKSEGEEEEAQEDVYRIMSILRKSDAAYLAEMEEMEVDSMSEKQARDAFYQIVQKPVQGVCRTLKRIGGHWINVHNALDGDKFVCFDTIRPDNCLIYSFGINNDWTFEDLIADMGCDIWTYDPSHSAPALRGSRIHFEQIGISNVTSGNMATLDHLLRKNGHNSQDISYLKADVEGAEMWVLPQWMKDGTLEQVDQFALELHMTGYHEPPRIKWLLSILQNMHKLNFRIISYEANLAMGKMDNFYQNMELVWMKDNVWNFLDPTNSH